MGKRKSDGELVRFVWKRNNMYDIMLLSEVETKNPFSFKNSKPVWEEIAKCLQIGSLSMKVTYRSCRERVAELLKVHYLNEQRSKVASGVEEPQMTEIEKLLTSVATLQEGGYDKQVNAVYKVGDKSYADVTRAAALSCVNDSQDEIFNDQIAQHSISSQINDIFNDQIAQDSINSQINEAQEISMVSLHQDAPSTSNKNTVDLTIIDLTEFSSDSLHKNAPSTSKANPVGHSVKNSSIATICPATGESNFEELREKQRSLNFFFNDENKDEDEYEDPSEKLLKNAKCLISIKENPKNKLVQYLEKKSWGDIEIRKDELQMKKEEFKLRQKDLKEEMELKKRELKIREMDRQEQIDVKREELRIREMEVAIKAKEVENKSKELDILLDRSKADAENQKKVTDLLLSLISNPK